MIKLTKGKIPKDLENDKTKNNKEEILEKYKKGISNKSDNELKVLFKKYLSRYNYQSVKSQLLTDQHGKCAYCESIIYEKDEDGKYKVELNSYGAIEHYRPKGGYKDQKEKDLIYPGYPWLAHSWVNFLYSCNTCNSAEHKGNLFPIKVTRHVEPIFIKGIEDIPTLNNIEDPLIINPYYDDPSIYFKYDDITGEIISKDFDGKGNWTIKCLGLKRLNSERLNYLTKVKFLIRLSYIKRETIEQLKNAVGNIPKEEKLIISTFFKILDEMIREGEKLRDTVINDDARFAGMMRYFKENNIGPFESTNVPSPNSPATSQKSWG